MVPYFFMFRNSYEIKYIAKLILLLDSRNDNTRRDMPLYLRPKLQSYHLDEVCSLVTLFVEKKNRNKKNYHSNVLKSILNMIFLFLE